MLMGRTDNNREVNSIFLCHYVPLHGPGHGDEELVLRVQHLDQVVSAGWTDGPQRVGAAFQLCDDQVFVRVAL